MARSKQLTPPYIQTVKVSALEGQTKQNRDPRNRDTHTHDNWKLGKRRLALKITKEKMY